MSNLIRTLPNFIDLFIEVVNNFLKLDPFSILESSNWQLLEIFNESLTQISD